MFVDEIGGRLIAVGLGFQPSTGISSRCGTEVDQNGALLLFRGSERVIDVLAPVHCHC
jgi:hypothetical protein